MIVMKCLFIFAFLVLRFQAGLAQEKIHIIPQPVAVSVKEGHFTLNRDTRIIYGNDPVKQVAGLFKEMISRSSGFNPGIKKGWSGGSNSITLRINAVYDTVLGKEGYLLKITPESVVISANEPNGLFYGIQSFKQLLPPQIESDAMVRDVSWTVPCVNITDYPEFKWRGLMLDVSRHFFTKQEVEKYIDEMAKYKFNVFHWHLTDDQGWRIQIKGLPELTKVGAWRVPRTGRWGSFKQPQPGEKATDGGFYTQQDIREIVRYAKARFVTILPEIDVPAHSLALIASYPGLSCTKLPYPVNPGSRLFKKQTDNVLCVGDDSTWLILNKVFTQVAALFPGAYIHVGGDEAYKGFWENCPKDQVLMNREGITSPEGLQSYFEKKLEKLILSKGKKVIGWDEILEGGLAPGAAVMSWRGMKGGIKATQMGHHVVMSPYGSTYISQLQGNPIVEPNGPGRTRMKECYFTNILPDGVDTAMILGGEGCLWTEHVPNFRHAEYMTWPRALALAEVFWGTKTDWGDFTGRVMAQFKYMDAAGVKYAPSMYDPVITPVAEDNGSFRIKLTAEIPGLDIYYRFDGTDPDSFSPEYTGIPLSIPKGASQIRIITYKDAKPAGRQINCDLNDLQKRIKKKKK
jgi:hexosaminidase